MEGTVVVKRSDQWSEPPSKLLAPAVHVDEKVAVDGMEGP